MAVALTLACGSSAMATVFDRSAEPEDATAAYAPDPGGREAPREMRVNGTKIWLAVGHTTHPPESVRRWYAQHLSHAFGTADGAQGVVAGFAVEGAADERSFGERLLRLSSSGDLGDLARLQMVVYNRSAQGGTDYVNLWTDGASSLRSSFGTTDAAGDDADDVPRFPGARRVFVVAERGQPQQLRLYRGPGSVVLVREFYHQQMNALGWTEDREFTALAAERGRVGLCFRRGTREVFLDLARAASGEDVVLSVISLGS